MIWRRTNQGVLLLLALACARRDDTVGADNEVINETFKKLFAWE